MTLEKSTGFRRSYLIILLVSILIVIASPIISAYNFSRFPWYPWISEPSNPPVEEPAPPVTPPLDPDPEPTPPDLNTLTPIKMSVLELQSLDYINSDRQKSNAKALIEDEYLNAVAQKRARQMLDSKTISHVIPVLGSPWTSLQTYKIAYKSASENLQYGARSTFEAHMLLMNSHSHKANILRKDFTHVGIAILPNGKGGHLQVQLFADR